MVVKLILLGGVAFGMLNYGGYLAKNATSAIATAETAVQNVNNRQKMLDEIGGMPAGPALPDISVPASPKPPPGGWKFPAFGDPSQGGPSLGTVTANGVSKQECARLAKKWAGSVTVNGKPPTPARSGCGTSNTIIRTL